MPLLRILILLAVSAMSACAWAADAEPPSPDDAMFSQALAEGAVLAKSGKLAEAVSAFDKVIAGYEKAFQGSEAKLFCARSPAESLAYLLETANTEESAQIVPLNWAYAYYLKAYSLTELGRPAEAKEMLGRAIALSPRNSQFLSELGNLYQSEKDWPKALETFQAAESAAREFSPPEQKNAELSRAWRGLGFVYVEQHKLDEAEKIYRQCLELDASDKKAANELLYVHSLRLKEGSR